MLLELAIYMLTFVIHAFQNVGVFRGFTGCIHQYNHDLFADPGLVASYRNTEEVRIVRSEGYSFTDIDRAVEEILNGTYIMYITIVLFLRIFLEDKILKLHYFKK